MILGYVMVVYMRTGKYQFKYQAYAIEWAINIMANKNGYSVNRAYQIDRVFGTMVEQWLNYYQAQLEQVKRFSVISGAYTHMIREFDGFGDMLREHIERFISKTPDYSTYAVALIEARKSFAHFMAASSKDNIKRTLDNMNAFSCSLIKITKKIEGLSLAGLKVAPKELQKDFTGLHTQGVKILNSIISGHQYLVGYVAVQAEKSGITISNYESDTGNSDYLLEIREHTFRYMENMADQYNDFADAYNALQDKYKRYLLDD